MSTRGAVMAATVPRMIMTMMSSMIVTPRRIVLRELLRIQTNDP
jgi:hypothetical protein